MRQLFITALMISIFIFLSTSESRAQDKIIQVDGSSVSGYIVSIDSDEIKLQYFPQNNVGWILRTFEVKKVKSINYNDFEYNLEVINIEDLIELFDRKENAKKSNPLIINNDLSLLN